MPSLLLHLFHRLFLKWNLPSVNEISYVHLNLIHLTVKPRGLGPGVSPCPAMSCSRSLGFMNS